MSQKLLLIAMLSVLASINAILAQAYLHRQPIMNAIMMDVLDATPARLAFFSPRRFPILFV
jgi:hypothetical protein